MPIRDFKQEKNDWDLPPMLRESSVTGALCLVVFVLYLKPADSINKDVYSSVNPESVHFGFQYSHIFLY